MMQSVALTESNVLDMDMDTDFVMVDCSMLTSKDQHQLRNNSSNFSSHVIHEDEEEEYDYCDDALSEGMQSSGFDLTEDMILEESEEPTIQSILDEAHNEAKRLIASASVVQEEEEEKHPKLWLEGTKIVATSSPEELTTDARRRSPRKVSVCNEEEAATSASRSYEHEPVKEEENDMDNGDDDDDDSVVTTVTNHSSRLSNKKRRKKMKLLKKVRAATTAKARLAEGSDVPTPSLPDNNGTTTSQFKKVAAAKKTTGTRYHNRRIATVPAVACASETLALYKAQVANAATTTANGKTPC